MPPFVYGRTRARSRMLLSMRSDKDYNPFSGPLAGMTGRLSKLRDQLDWARNQDRDEKISTLLFANALLVDLVEQLARKVGDLQPPDEESTRL